MMYGTLPTLDGTLDKYFSSDEEDVDAFECLGGTCQIILQGNTNRLIEDRIRMLLLYRLSL
jgi:hypothetical protein